MARMGARMNELWAAVGSVQAVRERARREGAGDSVEWAVVDEEGLATIAQVISLSTLFIVFILNFNWGWRRSCATSKTGSRMLPKSYKTTCAHSKLCKKASQPDAISNSTTTNFTGLSSFLLLLSPSRGRTRCTSISPKPMTVQFSFSLRHNYDNTEESNTSASKIDTTKTKPKPMSTRLLARRLLDLLLDLLNDRRVSESAEVAELVGLASDDLAHDATHDLRKSLG